MAWFTGAFSAGIFLAQYLLPEAWLLPCAAAAFVFACLSLVLSGNTGMRVLLLGTGLALALGYDWLYVWRVSAPLAALSGVECEAEMTLLDYASPASYGTKATVRIAGLPGKAVYYGDDLLYALRPGQTVRDTVRLQSAGRVREDELTVFTSRGVFLLAYSRGEPTPGQADGAGALRFLPARMGQAVREQIRSMLKGDEAAFLAAILTGDRSGLSTQASADLSEAGLSHILAVSGMHCGFLLWAIRALVGKHRRRLLALLGIPLLIFYVLVTGGSPSVSRACVMAIFLLSAPLFYRQSDPPTSLFSALFVILLRNPFAAASVSLQLSFGAMAGLLWIAPGLYGRMAGSGRFRRAAAGIVSASLGALALTAPLSLLYFGTLSLISPLSNLLVLWAAGGIFLSGWAAVGVGVLLPPLGGAAALIPALLIRYVLLAAHLLAKVPFHGAYAANPYLLWWMACAGALLAVEKLLGSRRYALPAALAAAGLVLSLWLGRMDYHNPMDAVVLDVGQGQSVALSSGGRFALVDCGSGNSWYHAGTIAGGQLRTMGCGRLDYLILTHYDSDHINGLEELLSRLDVGELLLPEAEGGTSVLALAAARHVPVRFLEEREFLSFGGGTLTVFPPLGASGGNEQGLSVLATVGETDLLITGDMNQSTERKLLASYDLPDIEALVAGHHGSRYSTSEALLDALAPETVCVSVGSNRYGHPAPDTLERIAEHGCALYRTDLAGNIHLAMGAERR